METGQKPSGQAAGDPGPRGPFDAGPTGRGGKLRPRLRKLLRGAGSEGGANRMTRGHDRPCEPRRTRGSAQVWPRGRPPR